LSDCHLLDEIDFGSGGGLPFGFDVAADLVEIGVAFEVEEVFPGA
jgi:hypothetical protein